MGQRPKPDEWYQAQAVALGDWIRGESPSVRAVSRAAECSREVARELVVRVQMGDRPRQTDRPTILVVGDAHFEPGQSLRRARLLGRVMRTMRPCDHVVVMGDWHGMSSICRHSSALEREGRRARADIDAGNDAITALDEECPIGTGPQRHALLGNHDARLDLLAASMPELEGLVGSHLYGWEAHGWEVSGFLDPLRLHGWRLQHYLPSRGNGRALSGSAGLARKLLGTHGVRNSESIVVGHTHKLDLWTESTEVGGRKWGLVAGCFFEHAEHYAGPDSNADWWRGLVFLRGVDDGDAAISAVPMEHLYEQYAPDLLQEHAA